MLTEVLASALVMYSKIAEGRREGGLFGDKEIQHKTMFETRT